MNACMQWSIENFGMTYPKIRTFAKCQSLAKMEMNQHFGKTNGNFFTYKHKRERDLSIHTWTYHYPLHTHMHEHHRYSPYTHTYMTIDPLHTHIMSIDHLHTYEHIIHIHINTSLHGQLTEMRDRSREIWKGEVRASTGEGYE